MKKALLIVVLQCNLFAHGQGCSDAGFCTMGAMRPNQSPPGSASLKLRSLEIGQYIGYTAFDDIILAFTADFNLGIGKNSSAQIKIPYMKIIGPLGENQGFGDVSMSFSRVLYRKNEWQFASSVGVKFPVRGIQDLFTNEVNYSNASSAEGKPLPMYYQSSLGTFDLIWGASARNRKWLLATGVQYSVNQNDNTFLWGAWKGSADSALAATYPKSKHLKRGTDIMFRVERNFRFSRFNAYLGALPIIRLNEDEISDAKGKRMKAKGSSGIALTGLIGAGYQFNIHHNIKVLFGTQILQREINPDGLSREWVTSINY